VTDAARPLPDLLAAPVVRRGRVRTTGWRRVAHGLHVPDHLDGLSADLAAWAQVLPASGCFTHLTSAVLRGWWLPPLPGDLPVFAAIARDDVRPKRAGIRTTRHRLAPPAEELDGLRVASPAETLLACSADLGLLDVVVLLDAALASGSCSAEEVAEAAAGRRRGAPRLRLALTLADARAESAWETLLRVLLRSCDVDVVPQHEVRHDGTFVARGDLWIRGTRTLQEYDGGDHLDPARHRDDLRRDRRIARAGWQRHGYTAPDLTTRAVTVLRDADRALGREHRPERIRACHALLAESLSTPAGTARLRRRWGLPTPDGDPGRSGR